MQVSANPERRNGLFVSFLFVSVLSIFGQRREFEKSLKWENKNKKVFQLNGLYGKLLRNMMRNVRRLVLNRINYILEKVARWWPFKKNSASQLMYRNIHEKTTLCRMPGFANIIHLLTRSSCVVSIIEPVLNPQRLERPLSKIRAHTTIAGCGICAWKLVGK